MKGYGNLSFRSVKKPKRANRFCFLWNAWLELLLNAPQPYNTNVTCHCITLQYNTLHYVTLLYTVNITTKVTIQKKNLFAPFMAVKKSRKHIKNSAFTAEQLKGMESSKLGMWKRYHLSIEGIRKGYLFCQTEMVYTTGLEINARKLAKCGWFW